MDSAKLQDTKSVPPNQLFLYNNNELSEKKEENPIYNSIKKKIHLRINQGGENHILKTTKHH